MVHAPGMYIQNQIKRALCEPSNIEFIRDLLKNKTACRRTELATQVCEQFDFYIQASKWLCKVATTTDNKIKRLPLQYFT